MRSGCLNLVLMLVVASAVTALTAAGVVLFLSFAALSFESPPPLQRVLGAVVALVAGYLFVRVGGSIWRDLRAQQRQTEKSAPPGEQEER